MLGKLLEPHQNLGLLTKVGVKIKWVKYKGSCQIRGTISSNRDHLEGPCEKYFEIIHKTGLKLESPQRYCLLNCAWSCARLHIQSVTIWHSICSMRHWSVQRLVTLFCWEVFSLTVCHFHCVSQAGVAGATESHTEESGGGGIVVQTAAPPTGGRGQET